MNEYKDEGYCIGCEHCKMRVWVPDYPLFHCLKGGEMDERTTETIRCPIEKEAAWECKD